MFSHKSQDSITLLLQNNLDFKNLYSQYLSLRIFYKDILKAPWLKIYDSQRYNLKL
jgi:hypothetical protein